GMVFPDILTCRGRPELEGCIRGNWPHAQYGARDGCRACRSLCDRASADGADHRVPRLVSRRSGVLFHQVVLLHRSRPRWLDWLAAAAIEAYWRPPSGRMRAARDAAFVGTIVLHEGQANRHGA